MKKLLFVAFAALLCCGLTACGGDDNNGGDGANYAELLVGCWLVEQEYENGEWENIDPYKDENTFFFGSNGTGYNKGEYGNIEWNYSFDYMITDNRIMIYYTEGSSFYFWIIQELTKTRLFVQERNIKGTIVKEIYLRRVF